MKKLFSFFLLFIIISIPVFTEEDDIIYRIAGNHFYIALAYGFLNLSDPLPDIMDSGINANIYFGYNLNFNFCLLGLGITTGCYFESTKDEVLYDYKIYSFPIALNLKFTTNSNFPLSLFMELNGGMALNLINYTNLEVMMYTTKFFVSTAGGYIFYIIPNVGISQYFCLTMIFFDDPIYLALSPGVRIEVGF